MILRRIIGGFALAAFVPFYIIYGMGAMLVSPIMATMEWGLGDRPWSIEFAETCRFLEVHSLCPESWQEALRERNRAWFEEQFK